MKPTVPPKNLNAEALPVLQRIGSADRTAVEDCVAAHGNLVWALARKYTDTLEEAEAATEQIFRDIWLYAEHCDPTVSDESAFIYRIAGRRLIKNKFVK